MTSVPPAIVDLVNFLIPASLFAIIALGLNVQWGHTGLFNAGVAAFLGLGAYTAAILITGPAPKTPQYPGHLGGYSQTLSLLFPPYSHLFVAMIVSMAIAALVGFLIAFPLLRLRADYFAIATLALAEVIRLIFTNAESLTAGTIGIILIPRPFDSFLGADPDPGLSDVSITILALSTLLVLYVVITHFTESPWGRVLRGIREDEEATLALGKNVFSFRLQSFVLGCAVMGIAGAILATFLRFVTPNQFDPLSTFTIYVMVILGGSGNNKGVILGAYLFYAFDWVSVRLKDRLPGYLAEDVPYFRLMVIGALLVLLIMFRPEGILREKKKIYPPVTK